MLLTSSQVSAVISSSIIIFFTGILFFSGFFLQRQSVKQLNTVLHPSGGRKGPWEQLVARAELQLEYQEQLRIEKEQNADGSSSSHNDVPQQPIRDGFVRDSLNPSGQKPEHDDSIEWKRRAYVLVVRSPEEVCDAVVTTRTLASQGSQARRILVHPSGWKSWLTGRWEETASNAMIQAAELDYGLETFDVDDEDLESIGRVGRERIGGHAGDEEEESAAAVGAHIGRYLLNLASDFDTLLYLQSRGMVLNATRLDTLFELDTRTGVLGVNVPEDSLVRKRDIGEGAATHPYPRAQAQAPAVLIKRGADMGYSRLSLRIAEASSGHGKMPGYTSVETTAGLARIRNRFYGLSGEDVLDKIGYVVLSPEPEPEPVGGSGRSKGGSENPSIDVEEEPLEPDSSLSNSGKYLNKRSSGGSTIPPPPPPSGPSSQEDDQKKKRNLGKRDQSLMTRFMDRYEAQRAVVCGSLLLEEQGEKKEKRDVEMDVRIEKGEGVIERESERGSET